MYEKQIVLVEGTIVLTVWKMLNWTQYKPFSFAFTVSTSTLFYVCTVQVFLVWEDSNKLKTNIDKETLCLYIRSLKVHHLLNSLDQFCPAVL